MTWPHYLASFFAGAFAANVVPHFTHGIAGDRFPTPFAKPPGKGLSSPTVNMLWALFNIVLAYLLFGVGEVASGDRIALILFFFGIAGIGLMLSVNFAKKHTN